MAGIKNLFKTIKNQKVLASKSLNDLDPGIESAGFVRATEKLQDQVELYIDFSNPANFSFYGSAEQYYRDAFEYIGSEYPYDGSGKEKTQWEVKGSSLDHYIYRNKYPRTNGYVTLGKDESYDTVNADGYYTPSRTEYIYFQGGPHPAPQVQAGAKVSQFFPARQGATPSANLYNAQINQQSNLEIDGDRGISVEFWLNKKSYDYSLESSRQVIVDLWNSSSWTSSDYGRFRVEISGASDSNTMLPNFHVELLSGSAGFTSQDLGDILPSPTLIMSGSSLTGSWNHFALSFQNSGSSMVGKLYQNGNLIYSLTTGSTMGLVAGPMIGQIGSLITQVSGANGSRGYGLLSASLDEFRFWKTKRTSQQIGLNWFTQINGGTNTDFHYSYHALTKYSFTNPVDLGFYYKFNEGITQNNATDSTILDYSGRITNGTWTGYGAVANQRSPNSAIVESSASVFEYKDPILYSYHPEVSQELNSLVGTGSNYDHNNNAMIYNSIPGWIRDEDVEQGQTLLKLIQIMSSYFDQLQIQIRELPRLKDINYISGSYKPYPFVDRLLDSSGLTSLSIFEEATEIERLVARDDFTLFSKKLDDTKNRIYQNIYNNLVGIYKSKGTAKSLRHFIKCFGVGEELVKLNLYGDEVTFDLKENFESSITRKRYANFYNTGSFTASVYQSASTSDSGAQSYLSASTDVGSFGNTYEAEVIFPKTITNSQTNNFLVSSQVSSLFGVHTVNPDMTTDDLWAPYDGANFQVHAVRNGSNSKDAYFQITGTAGTVIPHLTTSIQKDVYDNSAWNLAVRLRPTRHPWVPQVTGSTITTYDVEFVGYNTVLDTINNSFSVSSSISYADGLKFLTGSKRAFIGAHRTDFTGTVRQQSDAKISSFRVWRDYLDDKTILAHAKDPSNFGRSHPGQGAFLNQIPSSAGGIGNAIPIPQIETLALQWDFNQVTSSNALGEFIVKDYSSGSLSDSNNYGWMGPEVKMRHPGKGIDFPSNNVDVAVREYVYTAKQQPPEVLNSSDMVQIKNEGDIEIFTTDTRPINYTFTVEKSMNAIVTDEMLKLFATIMDFNNLIGEPVNRYRQEYKALEKIREIFFRRVQNDSMDFEKFLDYYKWIDDSLMLMLTQLYPISAKFSDKIFTMIESHVLERNKYWNKFPTLEMDAGDPEAGLHGISELLYPYKRGHAPSSAGQEGSAQCVGWKNLVGCVLRAGSCGGISKNIAGVGSWNTWANATAIGVISSVTFQAQRATNANKVGLKTTAGEVGDEDSIDFSFFFDGASSGNILIRENGSDPTGGLSWSINATHHYRIKRNIGGTVFYQRSTDGGTTFSTLYTSEQVTISILYPVISMQAPGWSTNSGLANTWTHPINRTDTQCYWWQQRAPARLTSFGDSTVDNQRDTIREANDWRPAASPPTLTSIATGTPIQYEGGTFALRNFTQPYRFVVDEIPEIHGGSNFPRAKKIEYAHDAINFDSPAQLNITASSVAYEKECTDIIEPNAKNRLEYRVENSTDVEGYTSGKGTLLAPFSMFSSSVDTGYASSIATNFKTKTDITNYHDDTYGDDKGIPAQGPFTERHVGGRQHRHLNINTASTDTSFTRAEAWNLTMNMGNLTISSRSLNEPSAIYVRDEYAKRPVNIRNIKWGTASQAAGNYRFEYDILQTSGRTINNRFFVKNEGFIPTYSPSTYITGVVDYALPDFSKYGATKNVFVQRFNAPGGPDVSSRGALDLYAEEFAVYNNLNVRNLIVRNSLNQWQTDHCGQFGIQNSTGTFPGYRQTRWENYDTLASYHKVNRNGIEATRIKSGYDRDVEFVDLVNVVASNYNRTLHGTTTAVGKASSNQEIKGVGYYEVELEEVSNGQWAIGITQDGRNGDPVTAGNGTWEYTWIFNMGMADVHENGGGSLANLSSLAIGDKLRILKDRTGVFYQYKSVNDNDFINIYSSTGSAMGTFYPRASFAASDYGFINPRISNPLYDNWFIQHPIPQSELQYSWINDSYDPSKDQPREYIGSPDGGRTNFTVPSGTTSITAPAVLFTQTSSFKIWSDTPGENFPVNFSNMFSYSSSIKPYRYKYTLNDYQVEWKVFNLVELSNDGTVIIGKGGEKTFGGGKSYSKVIGDSYIEFEADRAWSEEQVSGMFMSVALSNPNNYERGAYDLDAMLAPDYGIWIFGQVGLPPIVTEYDPSLTPDGDGFQQFQYVDPNSPVVSPGEKFRIVRDGVRVLYQRNLMGKNFHTFYTSEQLLNDAGTVSGSYRGFRNTTELAVQFMLYGGEIRNLVIGDPTNTLLPGNGFLSASTSIPQQLNVHLNTLNGPYGYPSWKQIRTGESPVARYQKKNNITSVINNEQVFVNLLGRRTIKKIENFVESPVTFKYLPLVTTLQYNNWILGVAAASNPTPQDVTIQNSFCNNLYYFAEPSTTVCKAFNLPSYTYPERQIGGEPRPLQIYDALKTLYDQPHTVIFQQIQYSEVIFPRGVNSGLNKTRSRVEYAEDAPLSSSYAIHSYGINGIDRDSLLRRSFWSNTW